MATNGAFTFNEVYNMKIPLKKLYIRFLEEYNEMLKESIKSKDNEISASNTSSNKNLNIKSLFNKNTGGFNSKSIF